MSTAVCLPIFGMAALLGAASPARGQARPYIGYVYPAGGQQGTTFPVKLGGQGLDDVNEVLVAGAGVSAKVVEYFKKLGPQEVTLLREQLRELKRGKTPIPSATAPTTMPQGAMTASDTTARGGPAPAGGDQAPWNLVENIEKRMAEYVQRPACASISSLVFVEVAISPDAEPGERELRLATPRGVSNPLVFQVGQLPEVARKPMITSDCQVLGKEELALRKRPEDEVEDRIAVPCTVNGQIASGEVNRYRFEARKGQRLVICAHARHLIPYIADAVPGWFQPVLALYNAQGKEVAYNDDYRFQPDPVIFFEVPEDGEYVFGIADAIYRGREDFVYRVTIGELPFVTSIFPLGGRAGARAAIEMKGWNLDGAELAPPPEDAEPGVHLIAATKAGFVSHRLPFALDTLPECFDKEPNDQPAQAQKVKLPIIVNGRIDRSGDWDVFQIAGRAGDAIVAEVSARRLDSPLDSMLQLADASGNLLAVNDDQEDAGSGVNTHHADSYLMVKLPADGAYYVHLGDTARKGGQEYAYRLRISAPQPDFALRVAPSSAALRSRSSTALSVYAIRKDGFAGDIKLSLKDPPAGFSAARASLSTDQEMAKLTVRTKLTETEQPVALAVEGRATIEDQDVAHEAVPAEDRMQAFLWRHLVPAKELKVLVYDPSYRPPPKRTHAPSAVETQAAAPSAGPADGKGKFTKQQVSSRLRQLGFLFEEWLITDDFYSRKVAECEAAR